MSITGCVQGTTKHIGVRSRLTVSEGIFGCVGLDQEIPGIERIYRCDTRRVEPLEDYIGLDGECRHCQSHTYHTVLHSYRLVVVTLSNGSRPPSRALSRVCVLTE
jgi:hypothetical protein